jgi:hypothetical protein
MNELKTANALEFMNLFRVAIVILFDFYLIILCSV